MYDVSLGLTDEENAMRETGQAFTAGDIMRAFNLDDPAEAWALVHEKHWGCRTADNGRTWLITIPYAERPVTR